MQKQSAESNLNPLANILVVDDEAGFCDVITDILEHDGCRVHQARDVAQAMERLADLTPDLILSDIMLPHEDGLSLVRRLRSESTWEQIPILILSALSENETPALALAAGANHFLAKPFTLADLRRVVDLYLPR